jgi:hypothetical protein
MASPYERKLKPKIQRKHRYCLRCEKPFISSGPGNQLCRPCRKYVLEGGGEPGVMDDSSLYGPPWESGRIGRK